MSIKDQSNSYAPPVYDPPVKSLEEAIKTTE